MADIARLAGVSPSTVSRALDDSPLVNDKTKERVKALAKKHSYRPHLGARNLRLKKSNIIVLVVPFDFAADEVLSNPYIFKILATIGSTLRKYGYDLLLSQMVSVSPEIDDRYIHSGLADGAIILGRGDNDPQKIAALTATGIPFVVLGPEHANQGYCSVGIDNTAAACEAVKHLANLGRQRIAIVTDNFTDYYSESFLRYQGYRQALSDLGRPFDVNYTALSSYSGQTGYTAVQQLLQTAPDLDAIFVATSDIVAIGAMQALADAKKRIPEEVAIIGFDNIDLCNYTIPPLTSISQRLRDGVADLLVQKLLQQITGQEAESTMLSGKLVKRQSCGSHLIKKK